MGYEFRALKSLRVEQGRNTSVTNPSMNKLLLTGGEMRRSMFFKLEEWQSSQKAVILEMDLKNKVSRPCVEYISPPEVCAPNLPAIVFKSASLVEGKLYACTSTEVMVYELLDFRLVHYVSLPCFNDLHHVSPTPQGTLLVVVTGLDMVIEVTTEGKIVREWSTLPGRDTWERFSRKVDYRRIPTTKPHQSHPNHVFLLDDEIWVTRFEQRDAISLTRPGRRIDIAVQRPHDGHVQGDSIYFTTVDGHIVAVNRRTLKIENVHNLNAISGRGEQPLGWCRGLWFVDDRFLWVGFTRVRPTKFRENLTWLKNTASSEESLLPTRLALYDLQRGKQEDEIFLEPHGLGVVFSLIPSAMEEAIHSAPAESSAGSAV